MADTKIGIIGFELAARMGKLSLPPDTPLVFMTEPGETLTNGNHIKITGPISNPAGTKIDDHPVNNMLILYGQHSPPAVEGDVVHVGLPIGQGLLAGDQVFRK